MPNNQPTSAREDYLKAIFHLGVGRQLVHTAQLAGHLGVSNPSVSGMVKRLAEEGSVDYSPRQGVRLTEQGLRLTMPVVRRHRLLETFLVSVLGLDWSEVHQEAEILEHHLSDRIVEALDRLLDRPREDPHGHPIPDAQGRMRERDLAPMEAIGAGEGGCVREMRSDETARLQRWKQLGLVPGALFRVERRQELEDVMHIRIGGRVIVTGREGIAGVFVERAR